MAHCITVIFNFRYAVEPPDLSKTLKKVLKEGLRKVADSRVLPF